MKKTMFITSVIMVVVMAIALTTSSLAWFSAQGAVEVQTKDVAISAAAHSSSGLYISSDATAWQQGRLDLTAPAYGQYVPVAPFGSSDKSNDAADILLEGLQNDQFVTNTVKVVSGGNRVWADAYSESADNFYKETDIYVANAGDATIDVSAAITFANTHGATLYVAVLARHQSAINTNPADDDPEDWELIALANSGENETTYLVGKFKDDAENNGSGDTYNDYFQNNASVSSSYYMTAPSTNLFAKTHFNLEGKEGNDAIGEYMQVKVLAWYSANLTNTNSGSYYKYEDGEYTTTGQNSVAKSEGTYGEFYVTFSQETAYVAPSSGN